MLKLNTDGDQHEKFLQVIQEIFLNIKIILTQKLMLVYQFYFCFFLIIFKKKKISQWILIRTTKLPNLLIYFRSILLNSHKENNCS